MLSRLLVCTSILLAILNIGFGVAVPLWLVMLPILLLAGIMLLLSILKIVVFIAICVITKAIHNKRKETY